MQKKIIFIILILLGAFFTQNVVLSSSSHSNGVYTITLDSSEYSPLVGETITITATVDMATIHPDPTVWCTLTYGDGTSESGVECEESECLNNSHCTLFDTSDQYGFPTTGCSYSFNHSYTTTGDKAVALNCFTAGWPAFTDITITVVDSPPVCNPDGCNDNGSGIGNGNCPDNCTVAEDPDCGCLGGNGCCGIGCNNANDSDCPPIAPLCVADGCNSICPANCDVSQDPDCGCADGNGCCPLGCDNSSDSDCPPLNPDTYVNPLVANDIVEFVQQILVFIFTALMPLCILIIIIGAYVMLTSGGIPTKFDLGRKIVIWALIGFAIAVVSRGIIHLVWLVMGR
jgi:hypothetical protein